MTNPHPNPDSHANPIAPAVPAGQYGGREVLVTGGTGALGSDVVRSLLDAGARVCVPSFSDAELERFEFGDHPQVEVVEGTDLTSEDAVASLFARFGVDRPLWGSVHVAGGFAMSPVTDTPASAFRDQLEMNLVTCFLCCREAIAAMRRSTDPDLGGCESGAAGRIVNVTARPGVRPELGSGMAAYTASKAGVSALTQSLAAEVADAGDRIWINAVVPSIMDTPSNRSAMPDADHEAWPKTHEVGGTIVFLASPQNSLTSGGLVPVCGRS